VGLAVGVRTGGRALAEATLEAGDPSTGVEDLLLAGVEGMAG
jgi:hypothetical protein